MPLQRFGVRRVELPLPDRVDVRYVPDQHRPVLARSPGYARRGCRSRAANFRCRRRNQRIHILAPCAPGNGKQHQQRDCQIAESADCGHSGSLGVHTHPSIGLKVSRRRLWYPAAGCSSPKGPDSSGILAHRASRLATKRAFSASSDTRRHRGFDNTNAPWFSPGGKERYAPVQYAVRLAGTDRIPE
jgi:hypothetical protein